MDRQLAATRKGASHISANGYLARALPTRDFTRTLGLTAGMNWYVNSAVRVMLNYDRATSETDNGDVDVDIAQVRAQIVS